MSRRVFDETSRKWVDPNFTRLEFGVVYWDDHYTEFGYFRPTDDFRIVDLPSALGVKVLMRPDNPRKLYFNRATGRYSLAEPDNAIVFAHGGFPYSFTRYYSTRYLEEMFQAKHAIKDEILYNYIEEMPYTFGLEFETSAGYIPEEELYRVGLIPLRDGSITGLEYSTIVLGGNVGINTLREQIDILKEYTIFDKECSLHIHYGSFTLTPEVLLRLNNVFATSDIDSYVTPFTFCTSRYKANGKDYCTKNRAFGNFQQLYSTLVGRNYFGSLYQPHPSDVSGDHKWNITTRYKALNLVNAVCYRNAKTAEFRLLRPTYNFDKILVWLFVLGAFVKYAESTELRAVKNLSVERILKSVYSVELSNMLIRALRLQKEVVQTQVLVKDNYGMRVDIEDQILTYKNLSKNCKFFY